MGQTSSSTPGQTAAGTVIENPEWTLMYHHFDPPFPGRAQAIRLLFVDAGVEFTETGEGLYGPEGFSDMFRGPKSDPKAFVEKDAKLHNAPYPIMAPPIIWHRPKNEEDDKTKEVFISQLPAIVRYVGTVLGYTPTGTADIAMCDKILLDVCDYITEGRNSFHPTILSDSYNIQKEEGDRVSKEWSKSRMLIFLFAFEKMLQKRTGRYIVGDSVSYADIALYWACEATEAQFNNKFYDYAWTKAKVPLLHKFKKEFDKRSNIAAWTGFEYSGNSMM